jgi:hypothetical protein
MKARSFATTTARSKAGLAVLVGAAMALLGPSAAMAGGRAGLGCPPGFVAVTIQEWFDLPLNSAGVVAGAHTLAALANTFNAANHNGDQLICAQDVAERSANGVPWTYFYNVVDDNSSAAN